MTTNQPQPTRQSLNRQVDDADEPPTIRLEANDGSYGKKIRVTSEGSDLFLDFDQDIATLIPIDPGVYALVRIGD